MFSHTKLVLILNLSAEQCCFSPQLTGLRSERCNCCPSLLRREALLMNCCLVCCLKSGFCCQHCVSCWCGAFGALLHRAGHPRPSSSSFSSELLLTSSWHGPSSTSICWGLVAFFCLSESQNLPHGESQAGSCEPGEEVKWS